MERNKWEAEFKEKLDQREITPTPHAWDRLDAMLNESESKQSSSIGTQSVERNGVRKLTWLYIAAGIAALLLLATLLFKPQKDEQRNEVVEQPKDEPAELFEQPKIGTEKIENKEQVAEVEATPEQSQTPQTEKSGSVRKQFNNRNLNNSQIAEASQNNPSGIVERSTPNVERPTINEGQTSNVERPTTNTQLASIESNIPQPKSVKVDPKSLLSQVDGELEMTFREKAIKTINKKFHNVKVAVANRNNQE